MLMDTTDTDTTDSSTERGLLMLRLIPSTDSDTTDISMERGPLRLIPTMDSDTLLFLSDLPLVWTPSPRDLMPPPRDMLLMLMDTTDSTELTLVKFDGKSGCDCYGFIYWTH